MDNINIFLLRLIMAFFVLHIVTSKPVQNKQTQLSTQEHLPSLKIRKELKHINTEKYVIKDIKKSNKEKHKKHGKKSKRDAYGGYGKYWAAKSSNYGSYTNNLPLYLVFNRKIGAYYPYYKYPKENSVRKSSARRNQAGI